MARPIRVLVVDDSAFMRLTLSRRLVADGDIEIVGTAPDGVEALEQVRNLKPDVVTMDVEMPRLSGLEVLAQLMAEQPTPVIMVSNLTAQGAETTARALTLGAVDCVAKPAMIAGTQAMITELASKIRQAAGARLRRTSMSSARDTTNGLTAASRGSNQREKPSLRPFATSDPLLAIGSSTGGPGALRQLLVDLSAEVSAPAVIVQHMPPGFTRSLADNLNAVSAWYVKEAAQNDRLLCGQALLAPGGYHMTFNRKGEASFNQDPPVNNVRPAVDVTILSLAEHFGRRMLGVILTGMGHDGREGALAIRRAGGIVIAEAESSCAVYGMPRSVVEAGAANYVAPLPELPDLIVRVLREISSMPSGRAAEAS